VKLETDSRYIYINLYSEFYAWSCICYYFMGDRRLVLCNYICTLRETNCLKPFFFGICPSWRKWFRRVRQQKFQQQTHCALLLTYFIKTFAVIFCIFNTGVRFDSESEKTFYSCDEWGMSTLQCLINYYLYKSYVGGSAGTSAYIIRFSCL